MGKRRRRGRVDHRRACRTTSGRSFSTGRANPFERGGRDHGGLPRDRCGRPRAASRTAGCGACWARWGNAAVRSSPGDSWDRHIRNTLGQSPDAPQQDSSRRWTQDGIDVMVLYPTAGLSIGLHPRGATTPRRCARLQRLAARVLPGRSRAAEDGGAARAAGRRRRPRRSCAARSTERAPSAAMLPTHVPLRPGLGPPLLGPDLRRGGAPGRGPRLPPHERARVAGRTSGSATSSASTRSTIPSSRWSRCSPRVIGGVFERFPRLRVAYLESGVGWVPYMMDRLDEEVEKRGADEAPSLTMRPSEYIQERADLLRRRVRGEDDPRRRALGARGHAALLLRLSALGRRLAAHRPRDPRADGPRRRRSSARCCTTTRRASTSCRWAARREVRVAVAVSR